MAQQTNLFLAIELPELSEHFTNSISLPGKLNISEQKYSFIELHRHVGKHGVPHNGLSCQAAFQLQDFPIEISR